VERGDIRLIEIPAGGKPLALNAGVAAAAGEILVFADARQRFSDATLTALAANFADPGVGGATGELVLDCESGSSTSTIGDGVGAYWKYEKWLRRHEGLIWSTLGATGAIYALRRSLWQPLPAGTLLDDVLAPMRAVLSGWRIVFEEEATAEDRTAADAAAEARRKRRTLAGNYQILAQEPRLLVPLANPVWLQYVSHKVGRLVVPWALIALFATSAALAATHWIYAAAFVAQALFYGLAAAGAWFDARERQPRDPFDAALPVAMRKEAR
jgi:biofilm PGA synthesis N-glycosyltransferase PgaC